MMLSMLTKLAVFSFFSINYLVLTTFAQKGALPHIEHRVGLWSVVHFLKINYLCALPRLHTRSRWSVCRWHGRWFVRLFLYIYYNFDNFIREGLPKKEGTRVRIPGLYHNTAWYGLYNN